MGTLILSQHLLQCYNQQEFPLPQLVITAFCPVTVHFREEFDFVFSASPFQTVEDSYWIWGISSTRCTEKSPSVFLTSSCALTPNHHGKITVDHAMMFI